MRKGWGLGMILKMLSRLGYTDYDSHSTWNNFLWNWYSRKTFHFFCTIHMMQTVVLLSVTFLVTYNDNCLFLKNYDWVIVGIAVNNKFYRAVQLRKITYYKYNFEQVLSSSFLFPKAIQSIVSLHEFLVMTTSSNGKFFHVTGPLWGESTSHLTARSREVSK